MPTIKVKTSRLLGYESDMQNILSRVNSIMGQFDSIYRNLDWDIRAESNINSRLSGISGALSVEARGISRMKDYLVNAIRLYDNVENSNSKNESMDEVTGIVQGAIWDIIGNKVNDSYNWTNFIDLFQSDNLYLKKAPGDLPTYDIDAIISSLKKSPGQLSEKEKADLLTALSSFENSIFVQNSLMEISDSEKGVQIGNVSWFQDEATRLLNITGLTGHYKDFFVNLSNTIIRKDDTQTELSHSFLDFNYKDAFLDILNATVTFGKDKNTFAANLLSGGIDGALFSFLGVEATKNLQVFGKDSIDTYIAKLETEKTKSYLGKVSSDEKTSLKSKMKIKDPIKRLDKLINNKLPEKYTFEKDSTGYYKNDQKISKEEAPTFYNKEATIAEATKKKGKSIALYDGTFNNDVGQGGKVNLTVGQAEAHAQVSSGMYVVGADGKRKFAPGISAEMGASVTALEVDWEQQWLGDEMFGLNSDVKVTVGKAEAKASTSAMMYDEDGKINPQLSAELKAEAIAAEIEGTIAVNVLGGEIGATGSLNFGIGAHLDVGYKDGVFKVDIGASLGVGASLALDVDIGGMVNTVVDKASAAWEEVTGFFKWPW